ncbi:MAG: glutathione S-transferase family protein [Deltaproteobacteria bacterium]|jgi:glutathione S-transferase|nr:glutathione S-transferase family protein [Deltaproteobacteria bacterium]
MSLTILGSPISPFVRKVQILLIEKQIDFEIEPVNPFSPPEDFRETSPLGKIPALRHDGRVVNDSSVICRYLERLHPSPAFYPDDPYECARAEWIEEYVDGGFFPVAGPRVFGNLVLRPMMGGEADEEGAAKCVEEDLPEYFGYLDSQLGESDYFVGDRFSIADLTVAAVFVNLRLAGVRPERERWPKLNSFLSRIHSRPSFRQVVTPLVEGIGKRWVELD